jgi:hypothetical protein
LLFENYLTSLRLSRLTKVFAAHPRVVGLCRTNVNVFKNYFKLVLIFHLGARGSVVVKALCYKPEGIGFQTR